MNRTWLPRRIQHWLFGARGRIAERANPTQPSRRVHLSLEELEPRVVLSTTDMTPPPTFFRAALALYIDGAELAYNQAIGVFTTNGVPTVVFPYAQANIDFNTPYAQPFSALLVLAGAKAELDLLASFNNNPDNQAAYARINNSL